MLIGISGKIGSGKDLTGRIIQYLTSTYKEHYSFDEWLVRVNNYNSKPNSDWEIKKFAGKLKQIVALLTGCTVEDLESQDFKSQELTSEWDRKLYANINDVEYLVGKTTYRWLLQRIGTEAMRDMVHTNIWVNALFADYKLTADPKVSEFLAAEGLPQSMNGGKMEYPNWIITDIRFPNEADAIKEREGLLIRIERPFKVANGFDLNLHPSEMALDDYHGFNYTIFNNGTIDDLVKDVETILKAEKII